MTQVLEGNSRSILPFSPTLSGRPSLPDARITVAAAEGLGGIDIASVAARISDAAITQPERASTLRQEIDQLLTPTERGQLAAILDADPSFTAGLSDGSRRVPVMVAMGAPAPTTAAASVTADQIRTIMPNAGTRADDFAPALNAAMAQHGITTPEQQAAFLAQISVESGDLRNTSENLNYSAQRMTEVWPRRYPTVEAARPYERNPEALANHTYANRNGNGDEASGDGYRFRGRGLMQVTGRENYRNVGYENDPDALTRPEVAADTAARFWSDNDLNASSETVLNRAEFNAISRAVNGGNHGSGERWSAYQRGLDALGVER